ncbi:uncharacterized protein EI90DRAFT_3063816 [Cantharellus anzutake]|uniref:uncharacterized protein n=1 Tax=Cantharellus anzutake TaxID=1750568 RepID=UPI001903E933|nr:uncharacterized protein EI90DRAFT_3063816 [Cantharellus anzutake]KAF8328861.1 hypothetical protein EI90DRAFT_3063816 [Cantharellus anzutake]
MGPGRHLATERAKQALMDRCLPQTACISHGEALSQRRWKGRPVKEKVALSLPGPRLQEAIQDSSHPRL